MYFEEFIDHGKFPSVWDYGAEMAKDGISTASCPSPSILLRQAVRDMKTDADLGAWSGDIGLEACRCPIDGILISYLSQCFKKNWATGTSILCSNLPVISTELFADVGYLYTEEPLHFRERDLWTV